MNVMDAKTALLEAKVKRGNIKRAEFNLAKAQQTYEREKRKYNDLMEQLDQLEIERVQLSDKYNSSTNVNKLSAEVHPQLQQQAAPKLQNYQHYIPQYPSYSKQNSDVPTVQIESVQLPQRGSYPPKRFSTPNDNFDRTTE